MAFILSGGLARHVTAIKDNNRSNLIMPKQINVMHEILEKPFRTFAPRSKTQLHAARISYKKTHDSQFTPKKNHFFSSKTFNSSLPPLWSHEYASIPIYQEKQESMANAKENEDEFSDRNEKLPAFQSTSRCGRARWRVSWIAGDFGCPSSRIRVLSIDLVWIIRNEGWSVSRAIFEYFVNA